MQEMRLPAWLRPRSPDVHASLSDSASIDRSATKASGGLDSSVLRAAAFADYRRIEQEHHPEPLPADVLRELEQLVSAADRE
jgi:hypothetical protein